MTAYVNVILVERKDVLLVPNAAFRFHPPHSGATKRESPKSRSSGDSEMKTVYVVRDGGLKPVRVSVGASDNRNTEVTGGELDAGDQVVVGEALSSPSGGPGRVRMRFF